MNISINNLWLAKHLKSKMNNKASKIYKILKKLLDQKKN